jgi:hypothetical protein
MMQKMIHFILQLPIPIGIYRWWKNFFNLDVHENEIVKLALRAFGFNDEYVCTTLLYNSYFSLYHNNLD